MITFAPGPSQLYFTVPDHLKQALREGIPSISHRSKKFESIYIELKEGLVNLLGIPPGNHVVFTSSASEIFERSIQGLVGEKSFHLVNGAFSKRYFEIAKQLGRSPEKVEVEPGLGFGKLNIPTECDLIAVTQNETTSDVSLPTQFIQSINEEHPRSLLIVDAVSSLPYPDLDYSKVDSVFFSVQKGFGLPAGLGVWIVNDNCVAQSERLLSQGVQVGSYHSLPSLISFSRKNQTPDTPNVLGIYLLAKVIQDFLRKGIATIRKETEYKSAVLYKAIEDHPLLTPFVSNKINRSNTVIVADCGEHTERLASYLTSKGLHPGDGYGPFKSRHLRFANFPAHSKEHFENLADCLKGFYLTSH